MAPSTPNDQLIIGDSVDYSNWFIGQCDIILDTVVTSRRGIATYGGLDDGYEAVPTSPVVREVPVTPLAQRRMIRLED